MWEGYILPLLCANLIIALPNSGYGQGAPPAGEFFFGGAKVWTYGKSSPGLESAYFDTRGWGGSITGNFNQYVGVKAEVFKYSGEAPFPPGYGNRYTFLFGPHVAYRRVWRITPFAHALVGATQGSQIILP